VVRETRANSADFRGAHQAQREACEAFINSQRHEGWVCLPACYDDGGFSSATMDRPALQRLLADIRRGGQLRLVAAN
jgi:DNA invertase Pin-like site-specific DNA recombinase